MCTATQVKSLGPSQLAQGAMPALAAVLRVALLGRLALDVRMRSHTCTESIAARFGNSNRRTVLFCAFDSNTRPDRRCCRKGLILDALRLHVNVYRLVSIWEAHRSIMPYTCTRTSAAARSFNNARAASHHSWPSQLKLLAITTK